MRRKSKWIHELPGWPELTLRAGEVAELLGAVRHRQGRLLGRLGTLAPALRAEADLASRTEDVVQSSAIEGEILDRASVRSSLARRLGVEVGALAPSDRHVDGVVEMMLDATRRYREPLTRERLLGWHAALFPTGRSHLQRIVVGAWRRGPIHVVSGAIGRERVHFEGPPARRLRTEMASFLRWFEAPGTDAVIHAALAHLRFVTVHPFDDGNGRIARAIADMALARSEGSAERFYSMSAQIRAERDRYYEVLERTQRGGTADVTPWVSWFLGCLDRAIAGADAVIASVLIRARFWERHRAAALNDRQRKVLARLLERFEGKLTSSKWARIARCSPDTALRDIQALIAQGILARDPAGGRSTSYTLRPEA